MDWSLVLISQGIESTVDFAAESGWGLIVPSPEHQRALDLIRQYRLENARWPWRQHIRAALLFDWGSLAWVILLCLFFRLDDSGTALHDAGLMDGAAVSHGEWWRLSTAIFLHADLGHLAANAGFGLVLLGLTMGMYGTGAGLLAAYLTGIGGNVLAWLIDPAHRSLGASGMVMGCVGLLAAHSFTTSRFNPRMPKSVAGGIAAGVMLFLLLGSSPGTDIVAHLGGFMTGIFLGSLLSRWRRLSQNPGANVSAGALFILLVTLTWWAALRHRG